MNRLTKFLTACVLALLTACAANIPLDTFEQKVLAADSAVRLIQQDAIAAKDAGRLSQSAANGVADAIDKYVAAVKAARLLAKTDTANATAQLGDARAIAIKALTVYLNAQGATP